MQVVLEPHASHDKTALVASVRDEWARALLTRIFTELPPASELLQQFAHQYRAKPSPARSHTPPPPLDGPLPHAEPHHANNLQDLHQAIISQRGAMGAQAPSHRTASDAHEPQELAGPLIEDALPQLKSCELKGEDYTFAVRQSGSAQPRTSRSVFIQLSMTTLEESSIDSTISRTIEFEHNLDKDTPGSVGQELQDEYHLSDTDRNIVTAIITECLSTLTCDPAQHDRASAAREVSGHSPECNNTCVQAQQRCQLSWINPFCCAGGMAESSEEGKGCAFLGLQPYVLAAFTSPALTALVAARKRCDYSSHCRAGCCEVAGMPSQTAPCDIISRGPLSLAPYILCHLFGLFMTVVGWVIVIRVAQPKGSQ
jgi:hypothetical protein